MLKYVFILMMLLPVHTFAGPTESTLQYILDDYQAECVAAQEEPMEVVPEGANLSAVRIKLRDDSIYEIDITADGKKATVLNADVFLHGDYLWFPFNVRVKVRSD